MKKETEMKSTSREGKKIRVKDRKVGFFGQINYGWKLEGDMQVQVDADSGYLAMAWWNHHDGMIQKSRKKISMFWNMGETLPKN